MCCFPFKGELQDDKELSPFMRMIRRADPFPESVERLPPSQHAPIASLPILIEFHCSAA